MIKYMLIYRCRDEINYFSCSCDEELSEFLVDCELTPVDKMQNFESWPDNTAVVFGAPFKLKTRTVATSFEVVK